MNEPSYEFEFNPTSANDTGAAVYRFARDGGMRVLDLGSGPAIVSSYLKRTDGKYVVCVDNSADRLKVAHERGVDRVIEADLEAATWLEDLEGESFDVIILADVLEHLRSPETLLRSIRERGLLAEAGRLVISIPNIAHEAVVAELLTGRFRYREAGLLDATHIRFFTDESFRAMLEREGYVVTRMHRTTIPLERTEMASVAADLPPAIRQHLGTIPEGRTYQFVACAEPATDAVELARLRGVADELERERDRIAGDAELVRFRQAEDGERLRTQLTNLRRANEALERKVARMSSSRSWRFARALSRAGGFLAHPARTLAGRSVRKKEGR